MALEPKNRVPDLGNKCKNPHLATPIRVDRLAWWLKGYDTCLANYLIEGFTVGFKVGYLGTPTSVTYQNHSSAKTHPQIVEKYLESERAKGRILGPFKEPPKVYQCSPIGLVPKKEKGDFRVIHDLSYPPGQSINDFIPPEETAVTYQSIDDAIEMLVQLGETAFMSKTDIEKAFRLIPLHKEVQHLFCMNWSDAYYIDLVMEMGCSSSCRIFEVFSTAITWIAKSKLGIDNVHYLDDFMLGSRSESEGQTKLKQFLKMCDDIGIPIAKKKTFFPNTCMSFLGIELDTVKQEMRLPLDKLELCKNEIDKLLQKKKARLREVQSVIGLLNFACQVIIPGRAFLRRLIVSIKSVKEPHHWCKLTEAKKDLVVWQEFLQKYNGKCFFMSKCFVSNHELEFFTDSSGTGFGAVFANKKWFAGTWSQWYIGKNIMLLELIPIVLAIEVWGEYFQNKKVRLFTDNMALVPVITKKTSKEPSGFIMILIRRLVLSCLRFNILLEAVHLRGTLNSAADALSRGQISTFFRICPQAENNPTPFPELPLSLR